MIQIEPKITDGKFDGAIRELNADEKATVTSQGFNGTHYVYYQGDEPKVEPEPEIIPPNWLGVEQSLRYSSAFSRRKEADPNDFSIFLATLINGKAGDASEAALAYAFGILGIVWTEPEMALINKILKDNNFTIQLK